MTQFYLIRHATNDYLGHAIAGRLPEVHLNEAGRQQASALAAAFAPGSLDLVYCSPMERCRETAAPLAQKLGLPVEISPALTELDFGEWNGQTMSWLDADPHWQRWNSFRSGTRMPAGEMMIEAQQRIVTELHRLHTRHAERRIAIVTHGDPIRAVLMYFLGMPLDFLPRLEVSPASVSALALSDHGPQVLFVNRCKRWASVP